MAYITKLPFEGRIKITYPYAIKDNSYKSGYHQGIDMVGLDNKNVYSITNGIVSYAGWENVNNKKQGFGLYISIKYDVSNIGFKKVFLGHLSKISVSKGTKVNNTTIIGLMGNTGFSTGSHTHIEIREYDINGKLIKILNPAKYMGIPNNYSTFDSKDFRIEKDSEANTKYKIIAPSGVNFRVDYSVNSAKITGIKCGEEVIVNTLFKGNKWLWGKTNISGKIGWFAIKKNDNSEEYAKKV